MLASENAPRNSRIGQQEADRLIGRIAGGDMSALESLYNAMYREIFGYLCSMLGGDRHSAEDLAQDTFVRVWKYAPRFSSLGRGRSWVYRIAGRLALDHLGKNSSRAGELKEELPDGTDVEESALDSHVLMQAMSLLPTEERRIVSMHAVSGLTLREIAQVLEMPLGTVKWKHAEAIKKLRAALGGNA
jgi:RNA polymerase sigma factor, sigma-70 family